MKPYLTPVLILSAILAAAILNCSVMSSRTAVWDDSLCRAVSAAESENWPEAEAALSESYEGWAACQTYLHIVAEHSVVDGAEAMYHRAAAFAGAREPSEFRAEVAGLREQLRLLAEMERFTIGNVL